MPDLRWLDSEGCAVLHRAAARGDGPLVEFLRRRTGWQKSSSAPSSPSSIFVGFGFTWQAGREMKMIRMPLITPIPIPNPHPTHHGRGEDGPLSDAPRARGDGCEID